MPNSLLDPEAAFKDKIAHLAEDLAKDYASDEDVSHVIDRPMPSEEASERIIAILFQLLFLGYYGDQERPKADLTGHVTSLCDEAFALLSDEIAKSFRHQCHEVKKPCCECRGRGGSQAALFMEGLGPLREMLKLDVQAAFDGDPAAKGLDEIIFSYPGLRAIAVHRISHALYKLGVPVLPRIMSEHAHRQTGIDIHPGAQIGKSFFIDHGTGIVVGETSEIGDNVRMYHGVTLGAFSLPTEQVNELRDKKRHPTIEDDVIIYPNATVLGGETVVGRGSVIGGNCWIIKSVPPNTTVTIEKPQLKFRNGDTPQPVADARPAPTDAKAGEECPCKGKECKELGPACPDAPTK